MVVFLRRPSERDQASQDKCEWQHVMHGWMTKCLFGIGLNYSKKWDSPGICSCMREA